MDYPYLDHPGLDILAVATSCSPNVSDVLWPSKCLLSKRGVVHRGIVSWRNSIRVRLTICPFNIIELNCDVLCVPYPWSQAKEVDFWLCKTCPEVQLTMTSFNVLYHKCYRTVDATVATLAVNASFAADSSNAAMSASTRMG